ncbi:hypothetical protein BDB00DRAFT_872274 [Zychaea mexicana]|uniref:uncharacterized protein n=1 Tax=Zychaea mexicana TaxID=64656 RepID=UPI0022FEA6A0|nr:uncharacterized protein BDB00DRAFT_872274 [Zychaea mexicana]KAI9493603.1 hypothetical protein BDB00DRAFT_872274 [Zychaea mexicana]
MLSTSSSHSIPVSQPSRPRQTTTQTNPLSDLIHTEKSYLETLRMIDSQIAPIWMKQTVSAAPDFSELLKNVHDILKVNKRFCTKLAKVASDPKAMKELGDVLMQWIEDMEAPYANFVRTSIPNLDQRSELINNLSISHLLENLSANFKCKITLETLFEAPLKRLHYYKALYHKLLQCTKPGRADHNLLLRANERIDTLINMSQNNIAISKSPSITSLHDSHRQQVRLKQQQREELKRMEEQIHEPLPSIKLDPNILASFIDQVDCSQVRDFFSRTSIRFKLQWKAPDVQLIMQDSFVMVPQHKNDTSTRIRAALTTAELAICRELDFGRQNYCLMFPPFTVRQLSVRAVSLDRELVGEYLLQFTINGTHHIIMRADSREVRNAWVGASSTAPSASTLKPIPLVTTVKQRVLQLQQEMSQANDRGYSMASSALVKDDLDSEQASNKNSADVYALYSNGSDDKRANVNDDKELDELPRARRDAFRDTIMDFYDGRFFDDSDDDDHKEPPLSAEKSYPDEPTMDSDGQDLANIQPRSVKILSKIPDPSENEKWPAVEVPSVPPVPPIPSNASDSKQKKSNSSNNNSNIVKDTDMGSAPVQMTYIKPEMHKMSLSSSMTITQGDDDDDDEDNRPLAQTKPSSSSSSSSTVKQPSVPIAPRSSSQSTVLSRTPSPNPPSDNILQHPQQQQCQHGGVNASNNGLQSVRSALAASVDSFAESTKSSPSEYSLARGSSSTAATERGSPSSIEQAKPVISPPPRKGSMPESVVRNEANTSISSNISVTQPQQQSQRSTPVLLPRTSSARHVPPPIRTTSIRQQQYAQPLASNSTTTSQHPLNRGEPNLAQSASMPTPRQRQKPPQLPPARLDSHKAPSTSLEDLASPPPSPGAFASATRQILYSHGRCEVFHWKDQRWYSAQESCSIHVRTTNANRSALSIQLLQSRQLYLNAWIVPTTVVEQQGESDVSVSLSMGDKKENYLIHFDRRADAVELTSVLQRVHFEATQLLGGPAAAAAENGNGSMIRANSERSVATLKTTPSLHSSPSMLHSVSLFDTPMPTDARSYLEEMPQTLSALLQCRGKLYSQVDPTIWNSMGSVTLRLAQQMPSKKMHVCIENGKHRLVSATVMSSNVKQVNPKRVSFLLTNEQSRSSMVYMVQFKDEKTTNKVLEYIKTKNEENGW